MKKRDEDIIEKRVEEDGKDDENGRKEREEDRGEREE